MITIIRDNYTIDDMKLLNKGLYEVVHNLECSPFGCCACIHSGICGDAHRSIQYLTKIIYYEEQKKHKETLDKN